MKKYNTRREFVRLPGGVPALFYEPEILENPAAIGVVLMHSDSDYLDFLPALALAARGFRVIAANVPRPIRPLDEKLPAVKSSVEFLRKVKGIELVVLLGHSGGATLMTAYEAVAENGADIFRGEEMITQMDACADGMVPADAMMLLDANFGNGAMTLLSIDPAVMDETTGLKIDPELDLYNPANGYDPTGSEFSDSFIKKYQKAQGERMNRLIDYARERISAINKGKGMFSDDEPMYIPGGSQIAPNNKMFPQDIRLLSRTSGEYPLIHSDGSTTTGIVPCVRVSRPGDPALTGSLRAGGLSTTVRTFLKSSAVRTFDNYGYNENSIYGVDWETSYCCGEGNAKHIHVPSLFIGMTGSYEYMAAETIGLNSAAEKKTIAFCEGAGHNFDTAKEAEKFPGQYGDSANALFDYVGEWLLRL